MQSFDQAEHDLIDVAGHGREVDLDGLVVTSPSLLKKVKCLSDSTFPSGVSMIAEASRSKSVPVVVRASQPSPETSAVRPGASLLSETLQPLVRLIRMTCHSVDGVAVWAVGVRVVD